MYSPCLVGWVNLYLRRPRPAVCGVPSGNPEIVMHQKKKKNKESDKIMHLECHSIRDANRQICENGE